MPAGAAAAAAAAAAASSSSALLARLFVKRGESGWTNGPPTAFVFSFFLSHRGQKKKNSQSSLWWL